MMHFTTQEQHVIQYLCGREEVFWEELAQFCKDPINVKLRTVQKVVSDIKKKYRTMHKKCPFECKFGYLGEHVDEPAIEKETVIHNGQTLTKVIRPPQYTPEGYPKGNPRFDHEAKNALERTKKDLKRGEEFQKELRKEFDKQEATPQHQVDFSLKKYDHKVVSRSGIHSLSDDDFDVFAYLYDNHEKIITIEELRDKVVYPLYGSKLPARWWDSIQRRINNVRRAVPELKNRIFTVKTENNGTGYLFK